MGQEIMEMGLGLRLLYVILQIVGFVIPAAAAFVLMQKEQNKTTANLMVSNIGCLIMNVAYFMMHQSQVPDASMMSMKFLYLGNMLFYIFFIRFLIMYTSHGRKPLLFKLVPCCWYIFEVVALFVVWDDNNRDKAFGVINVGETDMGYAQIRIETYGIMYTIRYSILACLLTGILIYLIVRRIKLRKQESEEKHNLSHLILICLVVITPLFIELTDVVDMEIVPFFASATIILITLSVLEGDFLSVLDEGRIWAFEKMESVFLIVDKAYGYLDSNSYARECFPELKNKRKGDALPAKLQEIIDLQESVVSLGGRFFSREITALEEAGKVRGYCLVMTDRTKEISMVEELSEAKMRAEDANEAKSAFISNMSHEIRTPMNAIVGMTEILLRNEKDDKKRGYLVNIKNSGAALLTIINDILDFSKIESGKMEIIEDSYEPMSMLSDLSMILLNRIGDKNIELLFDVDKNLPNKLYGDSLRIRQVILNIANNAVKFTDEGYVQLTIRVSPLEGAKVNLHVSVRDSGQGIKEEDMPKLFGNFQQVDTRKNRAKEGTGLGLSISKQLVELMQGQIGVNSVYGEGSEFYFDIPQTVVEETPATRIKEKKLLSICAFVDNKAVENNIRNLAADFGVRFVEQKEIEKDGCSVDFCFLDERNGKTLEEEIALGLHTEETQFVVLQNPMKESIWDARAMTVNKPLYSLNFCQLLNHEQLVEYVDVDDTMNFTAPEALVLIVDDNEMNLKVAKGLLQPLCMQIDVADSGKRAIEMVQHKQYHLIFMDHMMPVMDGVETTQHIRALEGEYFKQVPILALSANAVAGAKETFLAAGMNDFVAKPIETKQICNKIKTWLPKELIQKGVGRKPEDDKTEFPATEELPVIEGLDVAAGIQNSGGKELFISLLGDFYKLIELKALKIEKCLADGMIHDYTIEVHGLKNTARMIGALALSDLFYQCEQWGNAGDVASLEAETPKLLAWLRSFKPILEPYGKLSEENKETVSLKTIRETLEQIKQAMDGFDLDGCDAAMRKLEEYRLPEEFGKDMELLRAYVADVAIEEVMELCDRMIDNLGDE